MAERRVGTVSIDCGYSTAEQIRKAWTGIVLDEMIETLVRVAVQNGESAAEFVREHYARGPITGTCDGGVHEVRDPGRDIVSA